MGKRNESEIKSTIGVFCEKNRTVRVEAILDVLENDLDYLEIEEKYHDEKDPWVEQSALSARDYMDGVIEFDEVG